MLRLRGSQRQRLLTECITGLINGFEIRGVSGQSEVKIFDTKMKAAQRDRAALYSYGQDPLLDEVSRRVVERMEDCTRKFRETLILGGAGMQVLEALLESSTGVEKVVIADSSRDMIERNKRMWQKWVDSGRGGNIDLSFHLVDSNSPDEDIDLQDSSFDAVVSCLSLHWANDVPGVMAQCRRSLRPDGLFLATMLGGNSLQELRIACTLAHQEREGGVSPRTSPLAHVRDAGNLLTRAGLQIPSVDVDDIVVNYPDPVALVRHLREMGENNALLNRREYLQRDTALAAAAAYMALFGKSGEEDVQHHIPCTYQMIYLTGWSPSESQPKSAKRGSATVSFQDLSKAIGSLPDKS
eukprot:jgi/Picsp_1/2442/NSC_05903-R1_sam-dependent methyltransferase